MARGSNNVRGPQSALTEFLQSQGINSSMIARRVRARLSETVNADHESQVDSGSLQSSGSHHEVAEDEYVSDNLDAAEEKVEASKKRKLTKGKEKEISKKADIKRKKRRTDEATNDDDDNDAYTALSRSAILSGKAVVLDPSAKPAIGSFVDCAICETEFTATRYTLPADSGTGWLCHKCAKATGNDPFKKPSPRKRTAVTDKRQVVNFEENERVPALSSICIDILTRHLDDVEALGDLSTVSTNEILRVIARRRCLTAENAQLFYSSQSSELTLYDATNLDSPALCTLSSLNPNLHSLRLDYCGLLDDAAVRHWSSRLCILRRLELLGPFLVRKHAWQTFLEARAKLKPMDGFLITQSPRFDEDCISTLVQLHPGLRELRLREIGKMDNLFLPYIAQLKNLTYLELTSPGKSLQDGPVIELLSSIGPHLIHLNLSDNEALTDRALQGIHSHCCILESVTLSNLPEITDIGVKALFHQWRNLPFKKVDLSRCHELADESLHAILSHSSQTLVDLSINSSKDVSSSALMGIGACARALMHLDISWCREVDNFVVKRIMDGCERLVWIKCYGCNRMSQDCPRKKTVSLYGLEAHTASMYS